MELMGRRILITGGARRVGRALALAVAQAGADVAIHYSKSMEEAQKAAEEILSLGRKAIIIQEDLQNTGNLENIIDRVFNELGGMDALVNNAAIFEDLKWMETSFQDWDRHLKVNLTAPFFLSQAFAKKLPENEHGRIINILDWRALRPAGDHIPYTISKAALAALTKSLAVSFAPRIAVNGLALGAVLPPGDGSDFSQIIEKVPIKRWANLSEVTEAVIFLLSGPEYITGEIIHVDGGRHLV